MKSGRRRYASTLRAAETAERQDTMVAAAVAVLRDGDGAAKLSLERVARAAGVTRLTVYNQFGSRQGLLEAVAEMLARSGGLAQLAEVGRQPDAGAGLAMTVELFCRFWTSDAAVGSVRKAIDGDPEVAAALASRLSSGRDLIAGLVARLQPDWDDERRADAVDLIRSLVDYSTMAILSAGAAPIASLGLCLALAGRCWPCGLNRARAIEVNEQPKLETA